MFTDEIAQDVMNLLCASDPRMFAARQAAIVRKYGLEEVEVVLFEVWEQGGFEKALDLLLVYHDHGQLPGGDIRQYFHDSFLYSAFADEKMEVQFACAELVITKSSGNAALLREMFALMGDGEDEASRPPSDKASSDPFENYMYLSNSLRH